MQLFKGLFLCLAMACSASASHPLEVWHERNPLPTAVDLNGVAYGNGRFIAVGSGGVELFSLDAITWYRRPATFGARWNAAYTIAFGGDRFVVGGDGSAWVSTSGGGWTAFAMPVIQAPYYALRAVGFVRTGWDTNGTFHVLANNVGVGDTKAFRSSNGTNWIASTGTFVLSSPYTTIAGGNNQVIAAGTTETTGSSASFAGYYSNGTWGWRNGPRGLIGFGDGRFVIAEMFDTNSFPVTLRAQAVSNQFDFVSRDVGMGQQPTGICHGGGRFVVVGGQYAAVSADGTNWTTAVLDIEPGLKAVTYGRGLYVAVGTGGLIVSSPDGLTWTSSNSGVRRQLHSVTPDNDGFIAVGSRGTMLHSPDGTLWDQAPTTTSNVLRTVLKANGIYAAAGERGTILSGSNVTNLISRESGTERILNGLAYGAGTWIAGGDGGTIVTSSDAESWTVRQTGVTNDLFSTAYGAGRFVAVGAGGIILSSSDGLQWHLRSSPTNKVIADVAYGNGMFLAVTINGPALASLDGENWEIRAVRPLVLSEFPPWYHPTGYPGWERITYGDGLFVASGKANNEYNGLHFTSSDGRVWTRHLSVMPRAHLLTDIAYNNGRLVTVGNYGRIYQSDPIVRLQVISGQDTSRLRITGPKNGVYRIETSTSVDAASTWEPVTTVNSLPAEVPVTGMESNRFYRAVLIEE